MKTLGDILIAPVLAAGILVTGPALAQEDAERLQGLDLSRQLCAGCHVVEENQQSAVIDGVPSFPTLGRSGRSNAQLRVWLSEPHPVMPQMPLSAREVEAVIAYIRSFAD